MHMQSSLLNRIRGLPPISMKQNLNQSEGLHISKGQKGWAVEEGSVRLGTYLLGSNSCSILPPIANAITVFLVIQSLGASS